MTTVIEIPDSLQVPNELAAQFSEIIAEHFDLLIERDFLVQEDDFWSTFRFFDNLDPIVNQTLTKLMDG